MPISNVLVVDDSRTELLHLSDLLQRGGYTVRTAENAEQALQSLQAHRPDLILTLSGIERLLSTLEPSACQAPPPPNC